MAPASGEPGWRSLITRKASVFAPSALLALKNGKDDCVLKILRAHKFVLASDEKCASTRQITHETRDVPSRRAGLH
ncbi:MAG TPA: hypothetical protein VIH78_12125 [Terriglobales bacterium]|jgi:hypothetical protein